jgi:phenol hydroxylase P1 protein
VQFELRQQVVEPERATFDTLVARFGGRPATRYEEGSIDIQAKENFHYRPLWDPAHEIYDPDYSALKLADPYSFTDPRQFYYAPYVISRSGTHDAFGKTLDYISQRELLAKLPAGWHAVLAEVVLPLRHYEAGAQLISVNGAKFAYGTTIAQCLAYAAFDRIGNAQQLSRVGLELGGQTDALLAPAKQAWLTDENLQPARKLIEQLLVEKDWAVANFVLDLADQLLYPLLTRFLDESALLGGAGAYSLIAQHLGTWYADNRRWVDALVKCWLQDPTYGAQNRTVLHNTAAHWNYGVSSAVLGIAKAIDARVELGATEAVSNAVVALHQHLRESGIEA